jgi:hypothetical protein
MKTIVTAAFLLAAPSAVHAELTEAARLAAVYDTVLDARFEEAEALLKQTCPPAPEGACRTLRVVALWWQIQINPENRSPRAQG